MIVGVQGVPLIYVIREDVIPYFDPNAPYDDAIIQGCLMAGPAFKIDTHTMKENYGFQNTGSAFFERLSQCLFF